MDWIFAIPHNHETFLWFMFPKLLSENYLLNSNTVASTNQKCKKYKMLLLKMFLADTKRCQYFLLSIMSLVKFQCQKDRLETLRSPPKGDSLVQPTSDLVTDQPFILAELGHGQVSNFDQVSLSWIHTLINPPKSMLFLIYV